MKTNYLLHNPVNLNIPGSLDINGTYIFTHVVGTASERANTALSFLTTGLVWDENDTGDIYKFIGPLVTDWIQIGTAGAINVNPLLISGEDQTNDVIKVEERFAYHHVEPSQTAEILGTTGAAGDFLHTITWRNTGNGQITIIDGSTNVLAVAGIGTPASVQTGTYIIDAVCTTAWKITTGSGCEVLATGRFT